MGSEIFEQIRRIGKLPSPSGTALQVLRLAQDQESTVDEIAQVVGTDPAISARLLKVVNSPLAGMPRQIASVQRATSLLGVKTVMNLALGFSLVDGNRHGTCRAFDYGSFWSESVARAVVVRHITKHLGGFSPDEAFTCGLLSQLGRLALAVSFPERYSALLAKAPVERSEDLIEFEQSEFGIDHGELTAEMMGEWHFPEVSRVAVRFPRECHKDHDNDKSRAALLAGMLHFGGSVAQKLLETQVTRESLTQMTLEANALGISPHIHHDVFDAIGLEWRDMGAIFSVPTPRVRPLAELYVEAAERREHLHEVDKQTTTSIRGCHAAGD